jgi:hypothetical protein
LAEAVDTNGFGQSRDILRNKEGELPGVALDILRVRAGFVEVEVFFKGAIGIAKPGIARLRIDGVAPPGRALEELLVFDILAQSQGELSDGPVVVGILKAIGEAPLVVGNILVLQIRFQITITGQTAANYLRRVVCIFRAAAKAFSASKSRIPIW